MRILLVEDDGSVAVLLEDRFRLAGHQVTRVADGGAAWDLLSSRPRDFDLGVFDGMLPKLSGWDLCRRSKAAPETRSLPVILISADTKLAADNASCGADAFLGKPFDFKAVLETALRLAGSPR